MSDLNILNGLPVKSDHSESEWGTFCYTARVSRKLASASCSPFCFGQELESESHGTSEIITSVFFWLAFPQAVLSWINSRWGKRGKGEHENKAMEGREVKENRTWKESNLPDFKDNATPTGPTGRQVLVSHGNTSSATFISV